MGIGVQRADARDPVFDEIEVAAGGGQIRIADHAAPERRLEARLPAHLVAPDQPRDLIEGSHCAPQELTPNPVPREAYRFGRMDRGRRVTPFPQSSVPFDSASRYTAARDGVIERRPE